MSFFESHFFLFVDSFFAALILPPRSEMVVKIMTSLHNFNLYLVFVLSYSASVLGSCANWWIGKYFNFLRHTDFFIKREKEIAKSQQKWNKFLVWILLFSWLGVIGAPFAVMAGFFQSSFKKFLLLVMLGKVYYYVLLIFYDYDLKTVFA